MRQHGVQHATVFVEAGALLLHGQHEQVQGLRQLAGFIGLCDFQGKPSFVSGLRMSRRVAFMTIRKGRVMERASSVEASRQPKAPSQSAREDRDAHQRIYFLALGIRIFGYPGIAQQLIAIPDGINGFAIALVVFEDVGGVERVPGGRSCSRSVGLSGDVATRPGTAGARPVDR